MPSPICTLSDQERAALIPDEIRQHDHRFGRWYTDQGLIPAHLPRIVYLHPGRLTRVCACGWREHRQEG